MNEQGSILVIDDEKDHALGIAEALAKCSPQVHTAYCADDALQIIQDTFPDVIITDLKLGGDIDGMELMRQAKQLNPAAAVILITAYASIDTCKEAIRQGAFDYLVKPIDIDQLRTLTEQALKKALSQNADRPRPKVSDFKYPGLKSTAPKMERVFEVARRVSPTDISVLIEGSSGTGKELMAQAIHDNSKRARKPFNPINCAGLTETLLESELFGHVKGAFSGATADRKGLFETADKGTLFLDEIGDMPLSMQAKLLRVLEDGIIIPVGSNKQLKVDVRIISATNHDLTKLIEQKKFRQDLYFRIKGVSLTLAPLKERTEDIIPLAEFFLKQSAQEIGEEKTLSESAKTILRNYAWPGNIRQLKNAIRTMVVMCDREVIDVRDLPPEIHQLKQLTAGNVQGSLAGVSLDELEKKAIADTLVKTNGNREIAAKELGIGERTLYRKIKEYKL